MYRRNRQILSVKTLVAYFSWADNAVQNNIDAMTSASVKTPGNVVQLADWIAEETGGDLFSIQVSESYPADWDGCLARANEEKTDNVHPELVQSLNPEAVLSEDVFHVYEDDTAFAKEDIISWVKGLKN